MGSHNNIMLDNWGKIIQFERCSVYLIMMYVI